MEKYLRVEENTEFYSGRAEVMESLCNPGMALIQLWMTDNTNNDRDSAGIRLTTEQARRVGAYLLELANKLDNDKVRREKK